MGLSSRVRPVRTWSSYVFVIFAIFALSGCVGPVQVEVPATEKVNPIFNAPPTIPQALTYADTIRTAYRSRVSDQILAETALGLGSIAAITGLGAIAILGGSEDLAYGLAAGTAGGVAAAGLFSSVRDQFIYASGAVSIRCAMDLVVPLQAADAVGAKTVLEDAIIGQDGWQNADIATFPSLAPMNVLVRQTSLKLAEVESVVAIVDASATTPNIERASQAIANAENAMIRARAALMRFYTVGGDLIGFVDAVQGKVDQELISNRPDLGAFVASLSAQLPGTAVRPGLAPQLPPSGKRVIETDVQGGEELQDLAAILERRTAVLEGAIALVEAVPTENLTEQCNFDPSSVEGSLALDPSTPVTAVVVNGPQQLSLTVLGGRPPYRFRWYGQSPPAGDSGVKVDLETGSGALDITVAQGLQSGEFAFRISDTTGDAIYSSLVIQGAAAAPAAPVGDEEKSGCDAVPESPQKDRIRRIQDDLVKGDFKDGVVILMEDGTPETKLLVVDCQIGEITRTALQQSLIQDKDQLSLTEDQILKFPDDQLIDHYIIANGL